MESSPYAKTPLKREANIVITRADAANLVVLVVFFMITPPVIKSIQINVPAGNRCHFLFCNQYN